MKTEKQRKYPIGIQTFSELREKEYIYVDKTACVYRMTHANSKYLFLSRPRRFGKSLLTSTLRCYFEGKRELFKGLAIEQLEREWTTYPVLHFDMSKGKHYDKDGLKRYLIRQIKENEKRLGINGEGEDTNIRLSDLIETVYEKTGRQVVILIDEYDAPLLDVVHEEENLPILRNVMRNFYSPLKACDPYIRFVFMTGITKFSQLSIFSELNNIKDISMEPEYAAICGISKEELVTQMDPDLELFAQKADIPKEELFQKLIEYYDGYRFTWPSPDIFNPFSLMNAFDDGRINAYWFGSGTPTYLVEMLRKYKVIPQEIGGRKGSREDFDAPTERMTDITPLLYQSGYITIKAYAPVSELYTLDLPNKEVRIGLMRSLVGNYVNRPVTVKTMVAEMYEHIYVGDMDGALSLMRTVLSTVPYCDNANTEGHYQQLLAIIFILLGYYVDVEVHTAMGRVDAVMRTNDTLYLIELKLNKSAEAAMRQIDLKDYPERFSLCGLPVVKVGINFDSAKRTISDWKIEAVP